MSLPYWDEEGHDAIPDSEIVATPTSEGNYPLDLCYLWRKAIRSWHPASGSFAHHLIEVPPLARACRELLKHRGASFDTWDELAEWARAHSWPGLDKLLPIIEKAKQREQR